MDINIEKSIENIVSKFVADYMKKDDITTKWKKPLVAFADSKDPLFLKLKEVANPKHLLPEDILQEANSVISYFIPFEESIPISNMNGRNSSKEWAKAYIETNQLIQNLNDFLIKELENMGYISSKLNPEINMDYEKLTSVWSNRHVAYVAGLGTFGLNNMLITKNGCCGRLGNVVTSAVLTPTKRPDHEYCLYKFNGSCKYCVSKCVNEALFVDRFDRYKCFEMCKENDKIHHDLGGEAEVCGKCLTVVPCSFENPV